MLLKNIFPFFLENSFSATFLILKNLVSKWKNPITRIKSINHKKISPFPLVALLSNPCESFILKKFRKRKNKKKYFLKSRIRIRGTASSLDLKKLIYYRKKKYEEPLKTRGWNRNTTPRFFFIITIIVDLHFLTFINPWLSFIFFSEGYKKKDSTMKAWNFFFVTGTNVIFFLEGICGLTVSHFLFPVT